MARSGIRSKNENETEFVTYGATIEIRVTRWTDTYHNDTLADVKLQEQFPLTPHVRLENLISEIDDRIGEAQAKVIKVLIARGEFQRKAQLALGSGDIVEADDAATY